jgi:AraC-like DNA-binding protein
MLNNFNRSLELMNGFETEYIKILYYDLSPNYQGTYKSYEYSRFCTILEGEKELTLNNKKQFKYDEDGFILLPSNSLVDMKINKPTKALVLELSDDIIKNVCEKACLSLDLDTTTSSLDELFIGENKSFISKNMLDIVKAYTTMTRHQEFLIDLYAQELVYHLIQQKGTHYILNNDYKNPINQAIHFMNQHVDMAINIKEIAHSLNMSESNFSNLFKKIIGICPKDYIKNLKLTKAKDYLKEQSVTETAYNLGYENISHFIKLFKTKYGQTPKQYKNQYLLQKVLR